MLMKTPDEQAAAERKRYAEERAAERDRQRRAPGAKWYIVQCIRSTDQQALNAFERFKVETYYPTITQFRPLPRRRMSAAQRKSGVVIMQPQDAPVFPRYIFTRFDIQDRGWRQAFDYAGVGGLMCHSGMPVWMPDEAIERVRERVGQKITTSDTMRAFLDVGDRVIVNNGPFSSFPGIVEEGLDVPIEKLDASMRIKVAVNIFGRATPVELEYWQVSRQ